MNPKFLQEQRQFRKESRLKSWDTYRAILGRLCQVHQQHDFTRQILGLIRNQDVRRLVDLADSLSSQQYEDATQHFVANQFSLLIRKYPFPSHLNPFDPEKTAREKWLLAEDKCLRANDFFRNLPPRMEGKLHRMRGFISYVLGEVVPLSEVFQACDFGPGASLGVHGNATNVARKLASHWTVSPSATNFAYGAVSSNWHMFEILLDHGPGGQACIDSDLARARFHSQVRYVQHNKIAFVPKTVKTFRPIAVEPLLNGFVQKGIDIVMRRKLRRIGIDLSDQTLNQRMARLGSLDDSDEGFVTMDLSSASDSIASEVVKNLLPFEWFRLLDATRSKHYMDKDGETRLYHKFCSMGNGFCFPLETLIFAAACASVGCGRPGVDFTVYGDDIICRKKFAEPVVNLLTDLGFSVNPEKSFFEGPFRESCGADWFGGEDVRPYTLDHELDCLENVFKFLNLSERNERCKAFFMSIRPFLKGLIPPSLRFCRPHDGNPDSGYQVEMDEFMSSPYAVWDRSLQCWSWLELMPLPVSDSWRALRYANYSHMYAALSGASSGYPFTVRRKTKTTVRRVAYG